LYLSSSNSILIIQYRHFNWFTASPSGKIRLSMKRSNLTNEYIIKQAIAEDQASKDVTTAILIPDNQYGTATITAKSMGIVAGTEVAGDVFLTVDSELQVEICLKDGTAIKPGDIIAKLKGRIASILKAERIALNFLQHLSGIATETSYYVEAIKGLPTKITDTRKTLPGLRILEKQAVLAGGGKNHRMNLEDGILIKDNHIAALYQQGLNMLVRVFLYPVEAILYA